MHEVLVNRLGGLSLPMKSVARLTGRPDMTIVVYRGRKATQQQLSIRSSPVSKSRVQTNVFALQERQGLPVLGCFYSRLPFYLSLGDRSI